MESQTDHCPHCRANRTLICTQSVRKETDQTGKKVRIRTLSFHCEVCGGFVRSEDRVEIDKKIGF